MRRVLAVLLTLAAIAGAAWLVLRRGDVPFETLEAAYAIEGTSKFINLGDGEFVHYTDTGPRDAPVVILVHGFSASLYTWNAVRRDLSHDYRVITLDMPGHGLTRSDPASEASIAAFADMLDEFATAVGAKRFVLAGNSFGGHIAWSYTLAHPERVEGLVLIDASGWPAPKGQKKSLVFQLLGNPIGRAVLKDIDSTALVRAGLRDSFTDDSLVTDAMVERYTLLARAPGHRTILMALQARDRAPEEATTAKLSAIAVPALIVVGADDQLIPASDGQRFADAIPGATLKTYEGVGHLPQEEAPERLAADLRSFLATLEQGPAPSDATARGLMTVGGTDE